jgi:hypothetical protein
MWMILLYALVNNEPVLLNALEASNEQECREVAELSNRMFTNRLTLCMFIGPETRGT